MNQIFIFFIQKIRMNDSFCYSELLWHHIPFELPPNALSLFSCGCFVSRQCPQEISENNKLTNTNMELISAIEVKSWANFVYARHLEILRMSECSSKCHRKIRTKKPLFAAKARQTATYIWTMVRSALHPTNKSQWILIWNASLCKVFNFAFVLSVVLATTATTA